MALKIVIVAGGTGGHLFPGLVIAEKLKQGEVGCAITFIGRRRGLEAEIVPREGFAYLNILGEGWLGKSPGRLLSSVAKTVLGFFQSLYILSRLRPNIVVGMGGYLAGPFVLAAFLLGFHTLIHEQNLMPGITNRILSKFVDEVNISFAESKPFFPKGKTVITGNPVRGEIVRSQKRKSERAKTMLVMGGSRGAHRINMSMLEAVNYLTRTRKSAVHRTPFRAASEEKMGSYRVIHLSGREDYQLMVETYKKTGVEAVVHPFLHRMEDAYSRADLVICRAGATTLAELTSCGLPAILIPYPWATHGHQEQNARWLERSGGGVMIRDGELTGEKLAGTILNLMSEERKLARMAENSRRLGKPKAAEKVVERILSLAKKC